MNTIKNLKRNPLVAGISNLWYLPMSEVTLTPFGNAPSVKTRDLVCRSVPQQLALEYMTGVYSFEEIFSADGTAYQHSIAGEHIGLDWNKEDEIRKLRGKFLVIFKTGNDAYRFLLNARFSIKGTTNESESAKPHYQVSVSAKSSMHAWEYAGNVTEYSDGTIVLS